MKHRIAVTGIGIIGAIGKGINECWDSLLNYRSGIGKMKYLQSVHTNIPVAEVDFSDQDLRNLLNICNSEPINRTALLGIVAAKEAMNMAKLNTLPSLTAFINGTTVGGMEKTEQFYPDFKNNEDYIALHDCGSTTDCMANKCGNFAFTSTISTACSSAANAILFGANMLQTDKMDCVIAGGSECLTKFHFNGFHALQILSDKPCRPFDANRSGLTLGEGAAFLVLERECDAKQRKANILCYLSGFGNACDAYHYTTTSPQGHGAYLAMQTALQSAGLKPTDIDYINAHGTGTLNNDETEGRALQNLFGNNMPPFSSTKAYTGHTTSASGAIEAVFSILALCHNVIPANLNFETPMPELNIYPQQQNDSTKLIKHVLCNSFGFGGNDTTLIFSKS